MRDDSAFEPGMDWLHMLGVSQPMWDIFLTAIQNQLRKINPNIQVSCDSASAFESGGKRDQFAIPPKLGLNPYDWKISFETLNATRSMADSTKNIPSPLQSPIGKNLKISDLVIDNSELSGRRIDNLTNMFLVNHNIWCYLDAGKRANEAAFTEPTQSIPADFKLVLDIIEEAFNTPNWRALILNKKPFLDKVAKSKYEK
jgi:hypothetical protein